MTVVGRIDSLTGGKLLLLFEGEVRPIQQSRLKGLVFAGHPEPLTGDSPYQTFELTSGDRISATLNSVDRDFWTVKTVWGASMPLPQAAISRTTFLNGKLVYLSDLFLLASVEEVAVLRSSLALSSRYEPEPVGRYA